MAEPVSPGRTGAIAQQPKLPDEMGVWAEDGELVWLPRRYYPSRTGARKWAMENWDCDFLSVRVLARWMRWEPYVAHNLDGSVAWQEDQWWECDGDSPGAFQVWRLEAA